MKRALSTAWTFSMANATSDKQCLFLTYPEIKKSKVLIVMFVTLSIWNGILLLFALVANALVCTAILKSKELRIRTSNTLLLLLSLSDFFVSFTTQPVYLVRRLLELQDRYICWVIVTYRVLWHLSIGTSFLAICFIACERYITLFFTFSYKQIITTPRLLLSIGFSVASWAAFVFSRFLGLSTQHYYAVAISFIIILVSIITLIYVRIYKLAQRHHSQIHSFAQGHSYTVVRESKITKTTAYIVGSVFICYFPLLTSLVAAKFFEATFFHYYIFPVTDCIIFCNSSLNPLIYYWRNADLRCSIAKLFRIQVRQDNAFWPRSTWAEDQKCDCPGWTWELGWLS